MIFKKVVGMVIITTVVFSSSAIRITHASTNYYSAQVSLVNDEKNIIHLQSTDKTAKLEELYEIDGTNENAGYKQLKGYPNENEFAVYFQANDGMLNIVTEDLRNINLDEVVTWYYNGYEYHNTKKQLFSFFSDTSAFSSQIGISMNVLSRNWFMETFGDTYQQWIKQLCFSNDGQILVQRYKGISMGAPNENSALKPDTVIEKPKTGFAETNDGLAFEVYNNDGKLIGRCTQGDDTYFIVARLSKLKELPPRLADGWINMAVLSNIYSYDIKVDKDDIVFSTNPIVTDYEEYLRLNLPQGWFKGDSKDAEVNGVRVKKYILEQKNIETEWVDINTLNDKFGVFQAVVNGIDDLKLYGSYDSQSGKNKLLFDAKWPTNWQNEVSQKELNIDGLRVKRENNVNLFNVEDLKKLNILNIDRSKLERTLYFNIADLQKIGFIK